MVKIFRLFLLLAFGTFCAVTGAALENHRALASSSTTPIALLVVQADGQTLGVQAVTVDGKFHDLASLDQAQAIAKLVGKDRVHANDVKCGTSL